MILRTISRFRQLTLDAGDDPKQNAAQRQSIDHIGHHAEAIKQSDKKVNAEVGAGKGYQAASGDVRQIDGASFRHRVERQQQLCTCNRGYGLQEGKARGSDSIQTHQ